KGGGVGGGSGQARNEPTANRIDCRHEYDGHCSARLLQIGNDRVGGAQDDIRLQCDQLRGIFTKELRIARSPARIDLHVVADFPTQLLQSLYERRMPDLALLRIRVHQHADTAYTVWLLRTRRKRPDGRCATDKGDELTTSHVCTKLRGHHSRSI